MHYLLPCLAVCQASIHCQARYNIFKASASLLHLIPCLLDPQDVLAQGDLGALCGLSSRFQGASQCQAGSAVSQSHGHRCSQVRTCLLCIQVPHTACCWCIALHYSCLACVKVCHARMPIVCSSHQDARMTACLLAGTATSNVRCALRCVLQYVLPPTL